MDGGEHAGHTDAFDESTRAAVALSLLDERARGLSRFEPGNERT